MIALAFISSLIFHGHGKVDFCFFGSLCPYLLVLPSLSSLCKLDANLKRVSNSVVEVRVLWGHIGRAHSPDFGQGIHFGGGNSSICEF